MVANAVGTTAAEPRAAEGSVAREHGRNLTLPDASIVEDADVDDWEEIARSQTWELARRVGSTPRAPLYAASFGRPEASAEGG